MKLLKKILALNVTNSLLQISNRSEAHNPSVVAANDSTPVTDSTKAVEVLNYLDLAVSSEHHTEVNNPDNEPVSIVQSWEYAKELSWLTA